jgi:FMN-dependent NADH-azoreductase
MTLLRIDASIRTEDSASREIADIVETEWRHAHPGEEVIRRDVGTGPLPADVWAHAVAARSIAESGRDEQQHAAAELAARLADELGAADSVLLAAMPACVLFAAAFACPFWVGIA